MQSLAHYFLRCFSLTIVFITSTLLRIVLEVFAEWQDYLFAHARLQGSKCDGEVEHACHMPDLKELSVVEWHSIHVLCLLHI